LKIIAGIKMFPPEQQVVMVRAIDQADETWSETRVLDDARTRQSALRTHLQGIEQERAARMGTLQERIATTRAEGKALCDDIDARIAELAGKREQALVQTTHSVSELEAQMQRLEADTDQARRGITTAINALSSLLTFFKGEKPSG